MYPGDIPAYFFLIAKNNRALSLVGWIPKAFSDFPAGRGAARTDIYVTSLSCALITVTSHQ